MGMISTMFTKAFTETQPEAGELLPREVGRILDISIADIVPNPTQPRQHFPTEELTSLAKSISSNGVIQPLTVRRAEGCFELISGERRLRAAKMAGLSSVPCIVVKAEPDRSAVMALLENIQRQDLDPFEEARAFSKLLEEGLTQEELAVKLGLSRSTVANKLRLLQLSREEEAVILSSGLTERHARALLRVQDPEVRRQVLAKAARGGWTVDQTERYIMALEQEEAKKTSYRKRSVMLRDVRLFFNSVNKALETMRLAGVEAEAEKRDKGDHIEYVIRIAKGGEEVSE